MRRAMPLVSVDNDADSGQCRIPSFGAMDSAGGCDVKTNGAQRKIDGEWIWTVDASCG